jgi:DNA-3-methyladenine glycosylase
MPARCDALVSLQDVAVTPLDKSFYARPAPLVARDCLGKFLVFRTPAERLVGRIVETEAYLGIRDRAAHSYGARRTARNEVMWGPAGRAYVFFIYGMHFHLNLVTDDSEIPTAVLLRAVEPVSGLDTMLRRRRYPKKPELVSNGPGKLCEAFGIDRSHNGWDLCVPPLYLAHGSAPRRILRCPRIGVDYAGSWAARRLRFVDAESRYLSVPSPANARLCR